MKNSFKILVAISVALAGFAFQASAQLDPPLSAFCVGTTNPGTASFVIIPARSANNGTPRVQYLSYGSDKAGAKIQSYKIVSSVRANYTNSTTVVMVENTNTASTTVVIRHIADDSYDTGTVSAFGSTNLTMAAAPRAIVPGDIIYGVSTTGAASITVGAITNTIGPSSGGILYGQKGKPLLLLIDATGAGAGFITTAAGDYVN